MSIHYFCIGTRIQMKNFSFRSKHLYEVLYNRINSDLLLWQPCAPRPPVPAPSKPVAPTMATSLLDAGMMESIYVPCNPGITYGIFLNTKFIEYINNYYYCLTDSSSTTASESEAESENIFYSVYDKKRPKRSAPVVTTDQTNAISFQLTIGQGMLTMYTPVRVSKSS